MSSSSDVRRAGQEGTEKGSYRAFPPGPGPGAVPGRVPSPAAGAWPFVDLDHRLRAVLGVLSGSEAGAVVVSGPRGSGRTRLAQEAVTRLQGVDRRAEWVTGTRGGAVVPLGALAHLLPAPGTDADPTALWQALAAGLGRGGPGRQRPVIAIDDAHLLDDLSAALVHRIVLTRLADVVVTVVSGAQAPYLVDALRRDGLATRVELHALTRHHVDELLSAALLGTPESRTVETLWRNSHGSAALLRELVDAGRETGRLREQDGVCRWVGDVGLTDRLCEVVSGEMGHLADDERAALELLAVGGVLGMEDLVTMTSDHVVAALERRGLVCVEGTGRQSVARLAQPLHAQVLCAQLPQATAAAFRKRLADTDSVRRWVREDPVRIGALLLQLDERSRDAGALARAAAQANARSDHETAERLARGALAEASDPRTWVALAESLRWQGRPEEAARAGDAAANLPMRPAQRDGHTITTRLNRFYGLGLADGASAVRHAEGSPGTSDRVDSLVTRLLRLSAGEAVAAAALDGAPDADDGADRRAGIRAAVLECILEATGRALRGDPDHALATAARAWSGMRGCSEEAEYASARSALMANEWLALELGGRIPAAGTRAVELHRETMQRAPSACDSLAALGRGSTSLAAGHLLHAVRWLDEAVVGLRERDPLGWLPLAAARQAQAHALLGRLDRAQAALAMVHSHPTVAIHEPEAFLAEAWCAAASGRDRPARRAAVRAVESARAMGHLAVEARALDTCARLGLAGSAADRLSDLADALDGRLFTAYAAHADAAARQRAEPLEAVAVEFFELGAWALAADTYARAAEAHRQAGHRRRASAAGTRASTLARATGCLHTPAVERLAPYALTVREREIASLAAEGIPNRTIARRLVLSVRTVETHLAHAYDKLGISSRAALEAALAQETEH